MNVALQGLGVVGSRPIAVGAAYLLAREPVFSPDPIPAEQIESELRRFDGALDSARRHLERVRRQMPPDTPAHIAEFIDAHLLMLTDSMLVDATRELIREHAHAAGWALQLQRETLLRVFDEMTDPYLRARRDDVDQVVRQIQLFLQLERDELPDALAAEDLRDRVVVAGDLTPADAILLRQRGMTAFVTERGGPLSHTAILARSLDIPAVVGVHDATRILPHNAMLVVNAATGTVLATADAALLAHYRRQQHHAETARAALRRLLAEPSTSSDGVPVILLANLELPEDVAAAQANGASGVGLYRTEFLYLNRPQLPDEEEHLAHYQALLRGLRGMPLTIRTLDLGMDKNAAFLSHKLPRLVNPALGLRAIRLCLREPELFLPQLRAILRASAEGPVRLMLPMITNLDEVDTVLGMIHSARRALRREGLPFDPLMPIGAMIEVPAAALITAALARRLDFLSIGTNDLIQYTLAIDRLDDAVSYLYDPLHPAVLRLIRTAIEAAAASRTPLSMCGEMAGDPRYTRVLLALGLRELSMQPGALLQVKQEVRGCDIGALQRVMNDLLPRLDEFTGPQLLERLAAV